MSFVSNSESPDLRIYRPTYFPGVPQTEELSRSRAHVLGKIHSAYGKARNLLDAEPSGGASSSLCVGLLDPVSNLVISSLVSSRRKRKRGHDDEPSRVCESESEEVLERRSLDGMVAFLTRLFPDLLATQAVRYLFLADADPVVAAGIIASDVGMKRFYGSGPAIMEMALLKCAALAAGHPDPDGLVSAWRNISGRADDVLRLITRLSTNPPSHYIPIIISKLSRILNRRPSMDYEEEDMSWVWQLEAARGPRPCNVLYRHTRLLTRTLHDAIHAFYLQAIGRLPAGELRSRFHRSLLRAGYCYGPLDPVSNIIVNTIWYDAVFPPVKTVELDIIGTESLQRMENRSLYGMASFLCTHYHCLSFQQAVRCLLQADANLVLADPDLDPAACSSFGCPDTGVEEAFFAAAKAAMHPNPDAQVKLLTSCKAMLGESALSLLQGSNKLSSQDVQRLAKLLCPESPFGETGAHLPLPIKGYRHVHERISEKVNALLNAYERMPNGDPKFELHTICGVNDRVSPYLQHHYHHSHVNFIATPKSSCGRGLPTLFFAEIRNGYEDTSFCCPLPLPLPCAAQIRCLHCEFMGTRIVHPVGIDFHGGESEFEKMACRKSSYGNNFGNTDIINHRFNLAECIFGSLKEDSLYDDLDGHKIEERDLSSMSIEAQFFMLVKEV